MLNDMEKGLIKAKGINPDLVESADMSADAQLIKMKDGSEHRLCEVWSRCMGYLRPYQDYNVGKKSEFDTRKNFEESKARFYLSEDSCCAMAAE